MTQNWVLDERKIYFEMCFLQGKFQHHLKKNQTYREEKKNLKISSFCLSRGVAQMRIVSFLSVSNTQHVGCHMVRVVYLIFHLTQKAQESMLPCTAMFNTLDDALKYFKVKIYNHFQLQFSSFQFAAQSSVLTKSKTWMGKHRSPEQASFFEVCKDMAGCACCHWGYKHGMTMVHSNPWLVFTFSA